MSPGRLPQQAHRPPQVPVFLAEAEPGYLRAAGGFPRAPGLQVKIDPQADPRGGEAPRRPLPGRPADQLAFLQGVQVHQGPRPQGGQRRVPLLGPVVDDLPVRHPQHPDAVILVRGNDLRQVALLPGDVQQPAQVVRLHRISEGAGSAPGLPEPVPEGPQVLPVSVLRQEVAGGPQLPHVLIHSSRFLPLPFPPGRPGGNPLPPAGSPAGFPR